MSHHVLIGGLGFVGKSIYRLLRSGDANSKITIIDDCSRGSIDSYWASINVSDNHLSIVNADATKESVLLEYLSSNSIVYHLAASWITECIENPDLAIQNNVHLAHIIGKCCVKANVQSVVFSSSTSIYGTSQHRYLTAETSIRCEDPYSASKKASEDILTSYYFEAQRRLSPFNLSILRYLNIYGPHQHYCQGRGSVISNFVEASTAGQPTMIKGDSKSVYDFVYVDDVAFANVMAGQKQGFHISLVGTSVETSLEQLAIKVWQAQDKTPLIEYIESRGYVEPSRRICHPNEVIKYFSSYSLTPLSTGLALTLKSFKNQQPSLIN